MKTDSRIKWIRHFFVIFSGSCLLSVFACPGILYADDSTPPALVASPADDQALVIVNGKSIAASRRDAHAAATGLDGDSALDDLIDLELLRSSAAANRIELPAGELTGYDRDALERTVAGILGLEVANPRSILVVDHAWLKDSEVEAARESGQRDLEKLRELVVEGETIPSAYGRLQLDGTLWHIGDHEEYPADILPAEVRELPAESLSAIVPGDGGLHLIRIYERREILPTRDEIHSAVREELRRGAVIEWP